MTRYRYKTMPLVEVLGLTSAVTPDGSYLSEDESLNAYISMLCEGYRWIRTDGDFCVFELSLSEVHDEQDLPTVESFDRPIGAALQGRLTGA